MGRRINISTPTVINTELVPLDESFYLEYDGQLEQWYYDNTEQYAPNRKVTPLLLSPRISAFDKDTATSYSPTFATTQWYAKEWDEQQQKYVETLITNNVDSASADYVIQGDNLLVKKNVSYSHAVSIRCLATYIDPRDSGVTYTVEDNVNLTTNRTADVVFPEVDIISPSARSYNPLVDDENSQYDFLGVKTNNPVQPLTTDIRRYGVDVDGTEEIVENGKGVAPVMDIRYGEYLLADQEFMYRQTAGGTLVGESIDKAYIEKIKGNAVAWNQLLYPENYKTVYGLDYTFANGYLSVNGTPTTSGGRTASLITNFFTITKNHKYYIWTPSDSGLNWYVTNIYSESDFMDIGSRQKRIIDANKDIETCKIGANITLDAVGQEISARDRFQFIDLTLIYGAGNEPTTPEQFEADYQRWFGKPLTYEEYDAGSLRPVLMQSVKTTWFNQWDEEWEVGAYNSSNGQKINNNDAIRSKNFIPVIPNTTYYQKVPNAVVGRYKFLKYYYDSQKNYIRGGSLSDSGAFTVDSNVRYMTFEVCSITTYDHDICINISDPAKDGTYEPYVEKVQGFDVTSIKGKLKGAGESVTIFPDGMKKAPTVQDEIFVENGVVKAIKRAGRRAYTSGDESDTSVITDGSTTTFYALTTPEIYILDPITDFVWYGVKDNQEVLADTLPWYVSGQGTDKLTVDAMYGEYINVVLRCKMMDGETLSPSKAYASLSWRTPDIEPFVQSENGGAVRSNTEDMTFGTIININGEVLTDALKQKHLAFNWKIHKNNAAPDLPESEVDKGWGQRITIDASDLRNVKQTPSSTLASTLVYNHVYLKGAYEGVTDNGVEVTDNGETVYDRPID